jgi:hypothetical protein
MASELENVLRTLTMLEKALDRLGRLNYLERKQYPPIFLAVEETLNQTRLWIRENSHFSSLKVLYESLSDFLATLACLVGELWDCIKPKPGKRASKRPRRTMEQRSIFKSINTMLANLKKSIGSWPDSDTAIAKGLEKGVSAALSKDIVKGFIAKIKNLVSQRGEKTYVFPCKGAAQYAALI